jgi:hypothetical protein
MKTEQHVVEILQISCSVAASRQLGIYKGFTYIRNSAEIILKKKGCRRSLWHIYKRDYGLWLRIE